MEAHAVNRQQANREHQLSEKLGNAKDVLHHASDVTLCPQAVVVNGDHHQGSDDLDDRRDKLGGIPLQRFGVDKRHRGVADEANGQTADHTTHGNAEQIEGFQLLCSQNQTCQEEDHTRKAFRKRCHVFCIETFNGDPNTAHQ